MAEFEITVDDTEVRAAFKRLRKLDHDPKLLKRIALAAKQEAYDTFRHETDPWGQPWPPLATSTLKARARKGNYSQQMLIDTGKLYASIEGEVQGHDVVLSAGSGLPDERAWWNQFGTDTAPAREFFPVSHMGAADPPQNWWDRVLIAPVDEAIDKALS